MTPAAFADALVTAIADVLPAGFVARADGDVIYVDPPGGHGVSTSLAQLDPENTDADDYADAAWNVLSMVQDVVSESTAEPWPAALGPSGDLPEPGTRVDGRTVHLYFGTDEQPILTVASIPLDAVPIVPPPR